MSSNSCCRGPWNFPGSGPSHTHSSLLSHSFCHSGALHQPSFFLRELEPGCDLSTRSHNEHSSPCDPQIGRCPAAPPRVALPSLLRSVCWHGACPRGMTWRGRGSGRVRQAGGCCCSPSHGKLQHLPPPDQPSSRVTNSAVIAELLRCVDAMFRHTVAPHNGEPCSHLTDDETEVQGRGETHLRSQVTERGGDLNPSSQTLKGTEGR